MEADGLPVVARHLPKRSWDERFELGQDDTQYSGGMQYGSDVHTSEAAQLLVRESDKTVFNN